MTNLDLTVAASDQSILFTGEHPERGIFLALVEHAGGWPTCVTAIIDGDLVPLEALGTEAVTALGGPSPGGDPECPNRSGRREGCGMNGLVVPRRQTGSLQEEANPPRSPRLNAFLEGRDYQFRPRRNGQQGRLP